MVVTLMALFRGEVQGALSQQLLNSLPNFAQTYYNEPVVFMSTLGSRRARHTKGVSYGF